jgi:hypothetical protein
LRLRTVLRPGPNLLRPETGLLPGPEAGLLPGPGPDLLPRRPRFLRVWV